MAVRWLGLRQTQGKLGAAVLCHLVMKNESSLMAFTWLRLRKTRDSWALLFLSVSVPPGGEE